jgi:hypothetical protein
MEVTTIGIDLAKNVFAVCGADRSGRVLMRRQLRRAQVLSFMRGLPRCVVGMGASGGAQYRARQLTALGHEVLNVSTDMPSDILDLLALYPQPMRTQASVEYLPGPRQRQVSQGG